MRIPKWLMKQERCTNRQWRARKRNELDNVILALKVYNMGCAWTPDHEWVDVIEKHLRKLRESLSVKNWGH